MSDIKFPEGFSPISPDSDLGKALEKLKNINPQHFSMPQYGFSNISKQIEKSNREMEAIWDGIAEERERKEAAEEAYRQETIRILNAIEQNTANLYTLVDLISKSNEQQDELIAMVADILTIAKAKDAKEAESAYRKIMNKISQTVKDGETLAKLARFATSVYGMIKLIAENLNA